jgi:hypothetical protein
MAALAMGAVLVAGVTACGSGESVADTRVKELSGLTHAEFVAKLDKFCAMGDSAEDKAKQREVQRAFTAEDYGKAADLMDEQLADMREVTDKFRQIEPPAEDAAAFNGYVSGVDQAINDYVEPLIEAMRSEGGPEFTTLMAIGEQADKGTERSNRFARAIGATECVEDAS